MKRFLSGDEALAEGVRLARPQVISAYPITPQTVVVERLSEMVEDGSLAAEYVHVESEHSALSCAIGASATGARTFTATSSQGLLYMAECLTYASGGRFPIVMMNANRATALPWNIYGDQRDSLSLLDHGWIQVYAENNQEALDLALMAYAVAEDPAVRTPVMVNLDGFALTHTYETVDVPTPEQADAFLPPYDGAGNSFDFENPVSIGFSAGPDYDRYFKYWEHRDMLEAAPRAIKEAEARFKEVNEAYEVLSDPQKRARYDQFGFNDPTTGGGAGGSGFSGFGGFEDIFDMFTGGFGGGSSRGRPRARRGGEAARPGRARRHAAHPLLAPDAERARGHRACRREGRGRAGEGRLVRRGGHGVHQRELGAAAGRRTRSHVQLHRRPRRHLGSAGGRHVPRARAGG